MHGGSQRNDNEILTLMLEIYKAHKKMKTVSQKESAFSSAMVDAYKAYADGKVFLPENVNYFDSANKFCVNLTNGLKNQEKQQQQTGQKQTLEEIALKNLAASLSKVNMSLPAAASGAGNQLSNQTPTGGKSPAVTPKALPTTPVPVNIPNTSNTPTLSTTVTTTSIPAMSSTSTTTITPVMSRPRGRPPGSKNSTTKTDAAKNAAMQQKLMASILQPFAGSLSNLELITAQMEPSVKATVLALLAEPEFMKALAMFPDPAVRNTLLQKYFAISNFPNIPQLVDGFNTVFNYLASALQPQAALANLLTPPMKAVKLEKPPKAEKPSKADTTQKPPKTQSLPKSSAMSIFPATSKLHSGHSSLTTSPSGVGSSIAATITPVSSSPSLLKSNASTIISVGSGQLTITPSISITPKPNSTKPTSVLPQMPAPSFNLQKPIQPKVRRSAGDKQTKAAQKAQRLSLPDLPPIAVEHLPKSLSIIPTSGGFMTPKLSATSPLNVDMLVNKPVKQTKPKKKSLDGNKPTAAQLKKMATPLAGFDPSLFNMSLTNAQLHPQLSQSLMSRYNFLSGYEQFLSGEMQASLQMPKPSKSKTSTVTSGAGQQQKPSIKVKQLDQLQGRPNPPKMTEKSAPKSKQPAFTAPAIGNVKNPPIARSPTVLNAYGTTISSITHPTQQLPTSFSPLPTSVGNIPTNLQIR